MVKSIIKEVILILLISVAIILILGILFYDYIPNNRIVPIKESYQTPEEVKKEVNESITELEKAEVSYEITDSDLNIYKQSQSYKPGKVNPFSLNTNTNVGGSDKNQNTTDKPSTNTNETTDKNSTGTFFNDDGIK